VPKFQTSDKPGIASRLAILFCALGIWVMGVLAASPQLHAALHADVDQADHTCAVTLFGHGCDDGLGAVFLASAPVLFVACDHTIQPLLAAAEVPHRLPPGCGPPLS